MLYLSAMANITTTAAITVFKNFIIFANMKNAYFVNIN